MGSIFSDLSDIERNSHINKFFGDDEISSHDPFWNQFLSFQYSPNYSLTENNTILSGISKFINIDNQSILKCRNLINMISVFITRADELKRSSDCESLLAKDSIFLKQIYNGLFIIRYIVKALVENEKLQFILDKDFENEHRCILKNFCNSLLSISIEIPVNNTTYLVHLEIVLILNIIINSELYTSNACVLQDLLCDSECALHSQAFVRNLLEISITLNFNKSLVPLNPEIQSEREQYNPGSNLWRIFSLGYFTSSTNQSKNKVDFLSSECVFLILKLCLHFKTKEFYKKSLISLFDSSLKNAQSINNDGHCCDSLEISFPKLLEVISSNLEEQHFVLLFYILIHKNINFRTYVLSQDKFKDIIIPLLKLIYSYSSESSNFVYMALIILLIMTENNYFNATIHREIIDYLDWIKEKTITNISIGSLTVWILCRAIQYNFGYIGDRYIHINCLAALANMSSKFINLHPQASEQMMILFNILLKRKSLTLTNISNANATDDNEKLTNLNNNLSIIEEILQMLVEIVNTALIFSLNNNPHMIHTFLYHRKIFSQLKNNPSIQSHACNIDAILTYFSSKIEKELGKSVSSQNDVLNIIKKFSPSINKLNNFKRFPELKFKYIEQESSDEFFIPYIWKLLGMKSLIYFKPNDSNFNNCKC